MTESDGDHSSEPKEEGFDQELADESERTLPDKKTEVVEPSPPAIPLKGWLLIGICSHLAWGLYPVFARYFQAVRGLDGLMVLSGCNLLTLILVQSVTCSGMGGAKVVRAGGLYSLITLGRAATNMLSCKFTVALNVQLVTQLGPFVVAVLSRALLNEALPYCFLPALLASSLGAILAVLGRQNWELSEFTHEDVIGIILSFASLLFSAGMRIFMKASSASMSELELMSWQFTNAVPLGIVAAVTMSSSAWDNFLSISLWDCFIFVLFVLFITIFANFSQVASVRHLGPTLASSLQPLRLVSTIVGGILALGEDVHSNIAWMGLVLITVVLMTYLCAQPQRAPAPSHDVSNSAVVRATEYGHLDEQDRQDEDEIMSDR